MTLVNGAALGNTTHPAVAGGMQWYVDQVLGNGSFGSGGSFNRFYTNANVIQAGHTWRSHLTSTCATDLIFAAPRARCVWNCFVQLLCCFLVVRDIMMSKPTSLKLCTLAGP